jgi:hypothetical protein
LDQPLLGFTQAHINPIALNVVLDQFYPQIVNLFLQHLL